MTGIHSGAHNIGNFGPVNLSYKDQKVSIVISTYNGQNYILETLQSVLFQSHTNWQLLLVDDGSTDQTIELLTEFVGSEPGSQLI